MNRKKDNIFDKYKKQLFIIFGLIAILCLAAVLLSRPFDTNPSRNIKKNQIRTEEQVQRCMNAAYDNDLQPSRKICEKYDISPDGSVIIQG